MDSFGNYIYEDNHAARNNIAKPILTTLSSVRFLTEKEFLHGVVEENKSQTAIPNSTEEQDDGIERITISPEQSESTTSSFRNPNDSSTFPNPEYGDAFKYDKVVKERNKWIPECLDTIQVMKSVKICSTREIQKCLKELEDIVINSERNFTSIIVRSKRNIFDLISTPKKSDPDREMKQIQINKYLKTVSLAVKTANRIAQDQIHYLKFMHKFTTYLVRKGDDKLFLDCETTIIEMNQTLATLATEAMTRSILDLECVMAEFATYFGDDILQSVENASCMLKEEKGKFLYDVNDSSSDLMWTVRAEFQNQDSLRQKNKEKIQETIKRLQDKYQELGKSTNDNVASHEMEEYAQQADDLYVSVKLSLDPDVQTSDNVTGEALADVKIADCKDYFTFPRSKDPTKKTSLQPLLRKWTQHLSVLLQSLTSAHNVVLHNFHLYSTEAGSSYHSKLRDYKREFIEDFKHEYNEVFEHLLRLVKKMSTEKHGFPSPLDIMDMEHPDYPHLKERVIDTYVLHIKSVHTKAIDFIIYFTDKFGATVDKCIKLQYKLLKHNNNSQVNMNLFRYQNVLLLITLLRSFHNYLQKQIVKVTSLFQEAAHRLQLQLLSEFWTLLENFELQSAILTNAFTLALQGIVEKYYNFEEKCWKLSRDMGKRDISNLKGTLKQVYEVVQDFAITQPILLSKKEGAKVLQKESKGAIDGFLTRRFSKIHETSTPFSLLKVPGLLRSILKRDEDCPGRGPNNAGDIDGIIESKETNVVWVGAKSKKHRVRFEESEDGDGNNNNEEGEPKVTRSIPKDAAPIVCHRGEELHDDLNF